MIQAKQAQKSTQSSIARLLLNASTDTLLSVALFTATFIIVFALYSFTLAPGVVGGDAGEHQFAVPILGIPHTTGYPLYVLTGKLWTMLIPIGSMAWRMNLFSAFGGALAAGTTALVVYRLSTELFDAPAPRSLWAGAFVAGVSLSFGLTLWQWSVIAGVRSFNIFFFALLTLEAIVWAQQHRRDDIRAERALRWLALTVGLSLAHHRTTVFYLPSLIGWIWWHDRTLIRQPRRLLSLALLAIAPLSLYLFIYLRGINNPPYTHEPIYDLQSFWFLVGSGDSAGLFFSIDPAYLPARLLFIWQAILDQLSLPGVILAGLGSLTLLWQRPTHFFFQSLLVILLLLFTLDFEVVNLNEAPTWYLMPAYFIFAVWLGIGVNAILDFGLQIWLSPSNSPQPVLSEVEGRRENRSTSPPKGGDEGRLSAKAATAAEQPSHLLPTAYSLLLSILTAAIFLAILVAFLALPNWRAQYAVAAAPLDDWRQLLRGTQAQRLVESSLSRVAPNSIIWGDWEQYTAIRYYQFIHNQRPDVTARNPLNAWPEKVAAARAANQPIYFARKPPDLIGTPYLSMVGPLIYIGTKPNIETPADMLQLNANFEDELELIGYRAEVFAQHATVGVQAEPILQLMLYWRVPRTIDWDYALSLRLIDESGQELYKKDATHPVLSSYPTTLWTPGEVVSDFYELPLPPDAGPLQVHLIPYRTEGPGQWHNLIQTGIEPPQEGIRLGPWTDIVQ